MRRTGPLEMQTCVDQQVTDPCTSHRRGTQTNSTLVEFDAIQADLERVRRRGYAVDDGEAQIGLKCVGVLIRDLRGRYSHAISFSGPTLRMDGQLEEIIVALKEASRALSDGQAEAV